MLTTSLTRHLSLQERLRANSKCHLCLDIEWLKTAQGDLVRCGCMTERDEKERTEQYLRLCALPAGSEHMTLESFQVDKWNKAAHVLARQMAEGAEDPRMLTLGGRVDQGKTHLAIGICRRWLGRGRPAKYAYVPRLLDELREAYSPTAEMDYESEFNFLLSIPLLVLDDLGRQNSTPWAQEKLEIIIDQRLMARRHTVITTNKTMMELPETIASRLQRSGVVVALTGVEHRLRRHDASPF